MPIPLPHSQPRPKQISIHLFKPKLIRSSCLIMNYPLYRNYYYPATEVPVTSRRDSIPARKVIHVPVMDGSEKRSRSRSDSAAMIQKVLRGFLVRNNMKKIGAIKAEVDEMEKRITSRECMDLIRKDSKERLKINEMLMRLLLQLDSVRGFDSGVRDCRKAVIKKAIRLQELVDSIAEQAVDQAPEFVGVVHESDRNCNSIPISDSSAVDQLSDNVESRNYCEFESTEDIPEAIDEDNRGNAASNDPEMKCNAAISAFELNTNVPGSDVGINLELQSVPENNENEDADNKFEEGGEGEIHDDVAKSANLSNSNPNTIADRDLELQFNVQSVSETHGNEVDGAEELNGSAESIELSQDESQDESQTGSSANPDNMMDEDENKSTDSDTSEKHENETNEVTEGDKARNTELLEKLVEENQKMMGLMADLFKKNEMQTQLLSSLSQRVEHLERVFMFEKFRRKKKMNGTC